MTKYRIKHHAECSQVHPQTSVRTENGVMNMECLADNCLISLETLEPSEGGEKCCPCPEEQDKCRGECVCHIPKPEEEKCLCNCHGVGTGTCIHCTTPQPPQDWEKEFVSLWTQLFHKPKNEKEMMSIKFYLSTLLNKTREETASTTRAHYYEKVRNDAEQDLLVEIREKIQRANL